ncbi:mitochondrial peripheral inner membrane protein [Perkinsus olseni]|uniref:Mitochondrial peripheral inner membrane protein n=1 Tax=Perkinsus olseni TaxID=32597 RepID=A0A7J6M9C3_PEROL|nr:mitochondrial peripheral inner membrane protein [Perkinsus olseni]
MLVTLAEQRNDTIPVGGGSLKVDAAHYVTSRNGGRKMLRRGHVDYHGGSAGVDSRLAARWLLPTSHNSCGLGNSQRHLRLSSRDSEEVNTVNGTYMSAVPYEAHWPAAGVCWQLPALSQHDGQQVVWGPPLATSTTTTGSLLWQYLQPALLPWPYMVLDPHNHHALIYPCASHYHHHHQPSYGAVHSSGSGPFVSSGIAYNGRVPRCATTIVPSLSDDEYEEKTDACSYGHMYTPDNGPDDGCNSVALEAPVDDEDNIFLRGLMTILASMMEIGDEMERQRLLDHRPVSHAEFTGTYTPCISVWNYLQRLSKFFHCSSECFVLALVYLDRAVKATAATTVPLYVTSYNVHRLFLTSLVLAVKFNDDFYYSNRRYAEVGCLTSTAELNGLEAIMLKLVDFSLYVGSEEYVCYWKLIFSVSPAAAAAPPLSAPLPKSSLHGIEDDEIRLSRSCSESTATSWTLDDADDSVMTKSDDQRH